MKNKITIICIAVAVFLFTALTIKAYITDADKKPKNGTMVKRIEIYEC